MNNSLKTFLAWTALVFVFLIMVTTVNMSNGQVREVTFSSFIELVKENKVTNLNIDSVEKTITGHTVPSVKGTRSDFVTYGDVENAHLLELLEKNKIQFKFKKIEKPSLLKQLLFSMLPLILFVVVLFMMIKQVQPGGGAKALDFNKNKSKMTESKVTFTDVAGCDEAKAELEEIVEFLKNPSKFSRLGGRIPKGVLMVGPPGTGKTLLAKAVAGEADVPFFSTSGSDFVEMFVGVGASRVRDLFDQGKKHAPCIIFIDEIDAVGRQRGVGFGGGHDEREQTLNQLLVEMDGFSENSGVIIIAATNRSDVLDPALLRPGRFDRKVSVSSPDVRGREEILKVHTRKVPLSDDVNLTVVAKGTSGFSGADLENLVNEAALLAARADKISVSLSDLENAKDKVLMGSERKSAVISLKEKTTTAYHEAGHAIVGSLLPGIDPIHKVTIIPRGMALGVTVTLPDEDKLNLSKETAENMIAFLMGGRIAEELVLNQKTTGASNDIERATDLARRMVCEWGMADSLGPLKFTSRSDSMLTGQPSSQSLFSEEIAKSVDKEIIGLVERNYKKAEFLLSSKMSVLHDLANALLEKETLTGEEVLKIIKN